MIDKSAGASPDAKSLVVGAPRTGFALLLNILGELGRPSYQVDDPVQRAVNILMPALGEYLHIKIIALLKKTYDENDIIYNQTFRQLLGGPRWLDELNSEQACVRKYIGVKDVGDFTLLIYLPKKTLHYHDRIHSHYAPSRWINDPEFTECIPFASMRNPLGALYSASFSINAITGEYIDRFIGDEGNLREKFALFRLSDAKMVDGLASHASSYLQEFCTVQEHFNLFRWEDIIQKPAQTIVGIANCRGISISLGRAQALWDSIAYKNLTGKHQYNFRKNRQIGSVDDWKYFLTNEHLEQMKGHGIDHYMAEFAYEPITLFNERDYTPFQQKVSRALAKGEVLTDGLEDRNLQIFNWNKSNIAKTDHEFDRYPRKRFSCIERAHFSDGEVLEGFSDEIEEVMSFINHFIDAVYDAGNEQDLSVRRARLVDIQDAHRAMFAELNDKALMDLYSQRFDLLFDALF